MPVSTHTIHAICRSLFHSLWIGLAVAVLAGLVISLTKSSTSKLRYNLFCGLLMLFAMGTALAFFWEWGTIVLTTDYAAPAHPLVAAAPPAGIAAVHWTGLFDRWSTWIVGIWLAGSALKIVQLAGELVYLRKVRYTGLHAVGAHWQEKARALAENLHILQKISLLESALVKIPVTIGYFRPLILMPVGTLLQLSPEQVEAILYHELAHILRRDYLINILQSLVEAIFFFNPAVWWLSALIREEREACCDDLVLARVTQKSAYLQALMAFQQGAPGAGKLVIGLRRSQLMNRLRRIVDRKNQQLNAAEKIVLLTGFALLMVFTFVPRANLAAVKGTAFASRQVVRVIRQISPAGPAPQPVKVHPREFSKAPEAPATPVKLSPDTIKPVLVPGKSVNPEPKFHPAETGYAAATARARDIIAALIAEKVVTSQEEIKWFGLSADELIVNGIKLPERLHQKLKEAFGITPDNGVYYGPVEMQGTGDFFNKGDL